MLAANKEWTLCRDAGGTDGKWLVVLQDDEIKGLRDLREKHALLTSINKQVKIAVRNHYQDQKLSQFL